MRRLAGETLLVATHNSGKLAEIEQLLAPLGVAVTSAAMLGLAEPAETEASFEGNARIKAQYAARSTGLPTLADDSGIEIDALGGAPGVHTADWAETPIGRDFAKAMRDSHAMLLETGAAEPWRARFRCTLVLAWPDGHDEDFPGAVEGRFVWPMRGVGGHGYDPVFQPDGYATTFAEMEPEAKNAISHRADAFAKLAHALAR